MSKDINNEISEHERDKDQDYYKSQRVHKNAMMFYNVDDKIKKKKKVVQEDYNDPSKYQDDLVEQLERGNKKRIKFVYGDGQQRVFGQTKKIPDYGEKQVQSKSQGKVNDFIYEGARDVVPYNAPKKKKTDPRNNYRQFRTQGEDTRSLYDDPKLQRLRQTYTRKLLMKIDNEQQVENVEGCQWEPLLPHDKIPESYYMQETFKERVGPQNLDDKKITSEYDAFKLFFCDSVYARIIKYSKEKYEQHFLDQVYHYCHGLVKAKPSFYDWQLHERELDAYFSVHLFFGIVRLSNMRDYFRQIKKTVNKNSEQYKYHSRWKSLDTKQQADDQYAYFVQQKMAQIISYTRFKEIKQFMGLSGLDAKKKHPNDTLYRIREFITDQNEKYKKYYYPDEYLCIDEGMIPFGGKAKFKVYNPDKPTQWGIKEYLICDAVKAYTLHVQIYHGESTWDQELKTKMLLQDEADLSSRTMELVLSLVKPYEGKGHKVVMDNYYTSWQLLRELKNRGIGALGTIRHNRTGLKKQDLVKDHFQKIYLDSYCGFAFYINSSKDCILTYFQGTADKEVAMMTNYIDHSCSADRQFSFSKKHHYIYNQKLPYVVSTYNKYKGGVDRRNAYMVNFRAKFTVRKWWQAIFDRFFETALYNAFCIYKTIKRCHLIYHRGLYKGFRVNLMRILSERYKEYELRVKEGQEKAHIKINRLYPHTYLVGEEPLVCEECGQKTKNFCQECTMLKRTVIGVCTEEQKASCHRFHAFKDYLIDRDKIVIDKRFMYNQLNPSSMHDFYQQVGDLQKSQNVLKKEYDELMTQQSNKKITVDNLNKIVSLLKRVKTSESQSRSRNGTKTQDDLKKLIKDQLIILKKAKDDSQMRKIEKIEQKFNSDGEQEIQQTTKQERPQKQEICVDDSPDKDIPLVGSRPNMKNYQRNQFQSSDSDNIDEDEDPQMIDSDAEAKALVEEAENYYSGNEEVPQDEADYEDRETNNFKKFQLNYERNKSLHLDSNKQKKKSKVKRKYQLLSQEENEIQQNDEVDTNPFVDELHEKVMNKKNKDFPLAQEYNFEEDNEYPIYIR